MFKCLPMGLTCKGGEVEEAGERGQVTDDYLRMHLEELVSPMRGDPLPGERWGHDLIKMGLSLLGGKWRESPPDGLDGPREVGV